MGWIGVVTVVRTLRSVLGDPQGGLLLQDSPAEPVPMNSLR
jgi:hypothetical protein